MLVRRHFLLSLTLGFALFGGAAQAQEPPQRPRVGLVLGGGGALGWAHVGVLKALEERRIPVDVVVGTSAGGLVGGMLAAGLTPTEMEELVVSVPWDRVFQGRPSYRDLPFRRKEDRREYTFRLEFGLRGGRFGLPGGLDPAHPIGLLLSEVALPASPGRDFDDLVLPFRCVAVDLNTGTQKVMSSGSLFVALRATMAIPVQFTPVLAENMVLVDGGLLNNLPVDVAKNVFNPETIMAVKLSGLDTPVYGQESLADILGRTIAVAGEEQVRRNLAMADVPFEPDLSAFNGADFGRGRDLIAAGYAQAARAFDEGRFTKLMAYQLSPEAWATHLRARDERRRRLNLNPVPQFVRAVSIRVDDEAMRTRRRSPNDPWIRVQEVSAENERELAARFEEFIGLNLADPVVREELHQLLNRTVGEGRYESIAYELTRDANGQLGLLLRAKEKTYAPPSVVFGSDINTAEPNDVRFTLKQRTTFFSDQGSGSEARLDLSLGTRNSAGLEYYRPFAGSWFVAPRAYYSRVNQNYFQNEERLATYRVETYGAGVDVGTAIGRQGELRFGYDIGRFNNQRAVGTPATPITSGPFTAVNVRYRYDNQDGNQIPTSGFRLDAMGRYFIDAPSASTRFFEANIRVSQFTPTNERDTFFGILEGGSSFGVAVPPLQRFTLGGPFRLGAYDEGELQGDRYIFGSAGLLRRVSRLPDVIGGSVFACGWLEAGGAGPARGTLRVRSSASFGLLLETLVGPVFVGGSIGDRGHRTIYFTVGRSF